MNGVISLNTWSGKDLKGDIELSTRYGNKGTAIIDVLTGNTSKYFSYVMSYNYYETDGLDYNTYDDLKEQRNVRDEKKNHYFFLKPEGEDALEGGCHFFCVNSL
ncbi:MAG: hypothetical protein GY754_44925 [bacterium]|nr:hypothetical protein [bacterium]